MKQNLPGRENEMNWFKWKSSTWIFPSIFLHTYKNMLNILYLNMLQNNELNKERNNIDYMIKQVLSNCFSNSKTKKNWKIFPT